MHSDRKNITSFLLFRDVTDDEAFVDELRVTLRFFAAVLVRRTQKVKNNLAKLECKLGPIMIFFFKKTTYFCCLRWTWRLSSHRSSSKSP